MRKILFNIYFDFMTNYWTVEEFAKENNISENQAKILLEICKNIFDNDLAIHQHKGGIK